MYEHHTKPLIPVKRFINRLLYNVFIASILIILSLLIGVLGYHFLCHLGWIDALLNASMILTGMGPVDILHNNTGKLFASFYALFSGVAFLTIIAVVLAPMVHRFLHKFHLDDQDENPSKK